MVWGITLNLQLMFFTVILNITTFDFVNSTQIPNQNSTTTSIRFPDDKYPIDMFVIFEAFPK
jgi:hypothetical protein